MVLGAMCLTVLVSQIVFAQTAPGENKPTAPVAPVVTGVMRRDFVKRIDRDADLVGFGALKREGREEYSESVNTFHNAEVKYDEQAKQWNIFAQARDSKWSRRKRSWNMWIKYNEETGTLIISITKENRNQWELKRHPNIKVTTEGGKLFEVKFLASFEGTNDGGYNYNWMPGSWLRATR